MRAERALWQPRGCWDGGGGVEVILAELVTTIAVGCQAARVLVGPQRVMSFYA